MKQRRILARELRVESAEGDTSVMKTVLLTISEDEQGEIEITEISPYREETPATTYIGTPLYAIRRPDGRLFLRQTVS